MKKLLVTFIVLLVGCGIFLINAPKIAARAEAESWVKSQLKCPITAKFTDVEVMQVKGKTLVSGNVHSQNGFGAMVKTEFSYFVKDNVVQTDASYVK